MSHSVRRHMRIEIDAYDETIRRYIPGYEVMLDVAAHELSSVGSGLVLDLWGGTGALSEVILTAGTGTVELIDVDREMLAHARKRLARFTGRVRFSERSFLAALPHCNGVAASLALHHIPAIDTKRALYRRIHDALGPAGVFVNADATMPAEPVAREATWRRGPITWWRRVSKNGVYSSTSRNGPNRLGNTSICCAFPPTIGDGVHMMLWDMPAASMMR